MAGETRVIAFGQGGDAAGVGEYREDAAQVATEVIAPPEEVAWNEAGATPHSWGTAWLLPSLAIIAIIAWTAFFAWAHSARWPASTDLDGWTSLVSDWAMPVVLVCLGWLLAMRNSRRESVRFAETARLLSDESQLLETRLLTVNRELSLAREFIAAQSRDLDALGRIAADRLGQHADRLQSLVSENGARIETLGSISETALGNMEKLRSQLPVITSSAKDVTNNIGNAGRAAHAQLADLINGFNRLNEFGQASERQVAALRTTIDEIVTEFTAQCDKFEEIAVSRFAALAERGSTFRTELDAHEIEALAAIRTRADALVQELDATRAALDAHEAEALTSLRARLLAIRDEGNAISRSLREGEARALEGWQASLDSLSGAILETSGRIGDAESMAIESMRNRVAELDATIATLEAGVAERSENLAGEVRRRQAIADAEAREAARLIDERLAALDEAIAERRAAQERHGEMLVEQGQAISARLVEFEARIAEVARLGASTESQLSANVSALSGKLEEGGATLGQIGDELTSLTDASVRLLELLQASAEQTGRHMPAAIGTSEDRLARVEDRARALAEQVNQARIGTETLAGLLSGSTGQVQEMTADIERLQSEIVRRGEQHRENLAEVTNKLSDVEVHAGRVAEHANASLAAAIEKLAGAARAAVGEIDTSGATAIAKLAARIESETAGAIGKAIASATADTSEDLEQAAARAAETTREATLQLRDQLAKVNELVANLERRVAHARERAEEQVDNDFSRRAALITESLNSNAIDIAKAIASDVSDTSWAAYLRGDRGFFTRRAVSLLESGEAREIAHIYENDDDFREHVSRYIHDFEAILRQVLSTRDGHALGVTLLSSDMGKLYVALAQAIERLRD